MVDGIYKTFICDVNVKTPINLGNPNEFTMLELANLVIKLTNSKSKIIYKELPQDDPRQRKPDISRAIEILDWSPKIGLSEGISLTQKYFRGILNL